MPISAPLGDYRQKHTQAGSLKERRDRKGLEEYAEEIMAISQNLMNITLPPKKPQTQIDFTSIYIS